MSKKNPTDADINIDKERAMYSLLSRENKLKFLKNRRNCYPAGHSDIAYMDMQIERLNLFST